MIMLLWLLDKKLNGLPLLQWSLPFFGLISSSFVAGLVGWVSLQGLEKIFGTDGFFKLLLELGLAGIAGLIVFAICILPMRLPEVNLLVNKVRQRF